MSRTFLLGSVAVPIVLAVALVRLPADASSDALELAVGGGVLHVEFCSDRVVRVAYSKQRGFFARPTLASSVKRCDTVQLRRTESPGELSISSSALTVKVDRATGRVSFADAQGRLVLAEANRSITPAVVQGEQTFHVRQEWSANRGESIYGLGQHQLGLWNIRGFDIDLWQHNGTVAVPVLVSSLGYGVFWENTSFTRFGDLRAAEPIPARYLIDTHGKAGGLTASYFGDTRFSRLVDTRQDSSIAIDVPGDVERPNGRIHPRLEEGDISVRWEGAFDAPSSGEYLFQTFANTGVKLWIDDRLVIENWRQSWIPWFDVARVTLERGTRHRVKLEWTRDQGGIAAMQLAWKTPAPRPTTSLWSEVGDGVDYYFMYGPDLDEVVRGYRRVTGEVPLMPRWTFGLWQSRQRYETAQQSLDVLAGFRSRDLPIDVIVQDWFYWKEDAWGSHEFDPARFPDPVGWIRDIHDKYRARLMISVWGKFYPGTANFDALRAGKWLYEANLKEGLRDWLGHPYTFYDAFSPDARRLFWSQVNRELFAKGVDAWWLDATEPDIMPTPTLDGQRTHMHPTALGTGSRMLNAYSLVNSQGVYEGQRAAAPDQRVFILTRSAFAGQQRYAAATWSGDISSTWTALRAQVPAGLSFSLSGIPYWTMDVGGFSVPPRFSRKDPSAEDVEEWRELNTRWFQFGTFCPILRVHGEAPLREMWEFGGDSHAAYRTQREFARLRYRMLPYLYSLSASATHEGGTLMRPLVMDFRDDEAARETGDEFMLGPALLVSPVTRHGARRWSVYLPPAKWYDFWTGAFVEGGRRIDAAAPYDRIPVHVRAGAILPIGPEMSFTGEKPADPVTLYVYTGADGTFTLYEDDGLTYGYERGEFARIPLGWSDRERTLTIGVRAGRFPGMLANRTFNVVLVSPAQPAAISSTTPSRTVPSDGREIRIAFE